MITITINRDALGNCQGFRLEGHAGYAEYGQDIVCAAVSVLVINTINAIEKFTDDKFDLKQDEKHGLIQTSFKSDISEKTILLLNTLILGIEGVYGDYGSKYIKLKFKEV